MTKRRIKKELHSNDYLTHSRQKIYIFRNPAHPASVITNAAITAIAAWPCNSPLFDCKKETLAVYL
jgi:hypothetical protein